MRPRASLCLGTQESMREVPHHTFKPLNHAGQPVVIRLVRCVPAGVVMRIAVTGNIGHRQSGVACVEVGRVV